jgi:hypothetical protein
MAWWCLVVVTALQRVRRTCCGQLNAVMQAVPQASAKHSLRKTECDSWPCNLARQHASPVTG